MAEQRVREYYAKEMNLNVNIPEEEQEAVLEKVSKQLNFIKVVPEKMVLLDMKPDSVALKKIWENGKATIKGPGI